MFLLKVICISLLIFGAMSMLLQDAEPKYNLPIVGILAQEIYSKGLVARTYKDRHYTEYIAASYVKFVEAAGARVVPIWIGQPRSYYKDLLSKINGVLLPGGATYFNNTNGYADAGEHLIRLAMELNDQGTYMPIWGSCLGMELLVYVLANRVEARTDCVSSSQAMPLEFKADFKESRLFGKASDELINIWRTEPVTVNFHRYCYTEKTFAEMGLDHIWHVLSLNHDWNGTEFISALEHKQYPFYAIQFHPEKNLFEFIPNRNITHTQQAVVSSQYFARFFISETRKNQHQFKNKTEEMLKLIYNYNPQYTGLIGSAFEQQYLFAPNDDGSGGHNAAFGAATLWWSINLLELPIYLFYTIGCFIIFLAVIAFRPFLVPND